MGNQRQILRSGGFSTSLYETLEKYGSVTINGISAKVIIKKGDDKTTMEDLHHPSTLFLLFEEQHSASRVYLWGATPFAFSVVSVSITAETVAHLAK